MGDIGISQIAGNIKVGDDIKEVLRYDRQAWSFICALVLTISVPASMISTSNFNQNNSYNKEASYIFITSISICTTSSILVIWNSTYAYLKINQLEKDKLSDYMDLISKKKNSDTLFWITNSITILANVSFLSIAMLLVSATYLFYGGIYFWISMPILSFGIISVLYNEFSMQKIYNLVNSKNNAKEHYDINLTLNKLPIFTCNGCDTCNNNYVFGCDRIHQLEISAKKKLLDDRKIKLIQIRNRLYSNKEKLKNCCIGITMYIDIEKIKILEHEIVQIDREIIDIDRILIPLYDQLNELNEQTENNEKLGDRLNHRRGRISGSRSQSRSRSLSREIRRSVSPARSIEI